MKNSDFRKFYQSRNPYKMTAFDDYVKNQPTSSGYINPYILEERELHVTQLDIFSRLMMDRIIVFATEVDTVSASVCVSQLLYLDNAEPGRDITMYILSPGGSVYDGGAILDTMDLIKSDVSTVNTGLAASYGAVLLCSGTKGKRYSLKHARTMIHQPLGGTRGQASDIEIEAKEILKIKKELCQVIAENTGKSLEEVIIDCDRDNWMDCYESLNYGTLGLVDAIITKDGEITRESLGAKKEESKTKTAKTRKPKSKKEESKPEEKNE